MAPRKKKAAPGKKRTAKKKRAVKKKVAPRKKSGTSKKKKAVRKSDPWYVYMIRAQNGALYTGITTDLERRLAEHKAGPRRGGAKYFAANAPVKLVYREGQADRSSASKREAEIKKLPRVEKLQLIKRRGM